MYMSEIFIDEGIQRQVRKMASLMTHTNKKYKKKLISDANIENKKYMNTIPSKDKRSSSDRIKKYFKDKYDIISFKNKLKG